MFPARSDRRCDWWHNFSQEQHAVAAIRYMWPDKQAMANFFQLVNDAFDVLNSRIKTGKLPHQSAYGLALDAQDHVFDAMSVMLANTHAIGKKILLPFQKGFLLSIAATKGLFNDIRSRFGAHYFMTTRLNQDCLENDEKSVEEQRNCSEYLSVQLLNGVSLVVDVNDGGGDDDTSRILEELSADETSTVFRERDAC